MGNTVHLVVADGARRERLKDILCRAADFGPVIDNPNIAGHSEAINLYVVDLAHPFAALPVFWMATHVLNPGARRMALLDSSIHPSIVQTAVHGGAYYMAAWADPPRRLLAVAQAAYLGRNYIPLGEPLRAISQLFDRLQWDELDHLAQTLRVNLVTGQVSRGARLFQLTRLQFKLVSHLSQHAGEVVSYTELLWRAWGEHSITDKSTNQIKSVIRRLRREIEPNPQQPQYICSAYGRGYSIPAHLVELCATPTSRL